MLYKVKNPMQPIKRHSLLGILPKPPFRQILPTRPLRQIAPQRGITWKTIALVFVRIGWDMQEQTNLFIKVYHPQTTQTVTLSKMGPGQVLINHSYRILTTSKLHELENYAEQQALAHPIQKIT